MKTKLDDGAKGHTWFLVGIAYIERSLRLALIEGLRSAEREDVMVEGFKLCRAYPVGVADESRKIKVSFKGVCLHQVVDESYGVWDDYEQRDDENYLQVLSQSRLLDFANEHYVLIRELSGPDARHYRVWTEDVVVDVISTEPPVFDELRDSMEIYR